MPDYLLPCRCGQKLRVTTAQAGDTISCSCGNKLSVPTLRGLRDLEPAPAVAAAPVAPRWTRSHGMAFASGLTLGAAALCFLSYFGLRYAQLAASPYLADLTEPTIKAEGARIDQMTPSELLDIWNQTVADGLGQPEEPHWIRANRMLAGYKTWITASLIALALGGTLATSSLLISRR